MHPNAEVGCAQERPSCRCPTGQRTHSKATWVHNVVAHSSASKPSGQSSAFQGSPACRAMRTR